MTSSGRSLCWLLSLVVCLGLMSLPSTSGFQSLHTTRRTPTFGSNNNPRSTWTARYIFGRDNSNNNNNDEDKQGADEKSEDKESRLPFFSRFLRKDEQEAKTDTPVAESNNDKDNNNNKKPMEPPAVAVLEKPVAQEPAKKMEELSPVEQAKILRAQAEKARLEAERMDAELTLEKITRLERELAHAKKTSLTSNVTAQTEVESLMRELDILQAKMRGETVAAVATPKPSVSKPASSSESRTSSSASSPKQKGATPRY